MDLLKNLDVVDTEIQEAINKELSRQRDKLEMIASENIVSKAVMQAQGSVLTNKYAEGYPGKRYYGGCEYVDVVEQLAIDRAKKLFGAEYAVSLFSRIASSTFPFVPALPSSVAA